MHAFISCFVYVCILQSRLLLVNWPVTPSVRIPFFLHTRPPTHPCSLLVALLLVSINTYCSWEIKFSTFASILVMSFIDKIWFEDCLTIDFWQSFYHPNFICIENFGGPKPLFNFKSPLDLSESMMILEKYQTLDFTQFLIFSFSFHAVTMSLFWWVPRGHFTNFEFIF